MKYTFPKNTRYLLFGIAMASAISIASAATFNAPTAAAPAANIPVPLHVGPDQVKNGDLSVNTFSAMANAQFKQQTFLNGTVFGSTPSNTQSASTVPIGDSTTPENAKVSDSISAVGHIQSAKTANSSSQNLCAGTDGTIVTCSKTPNSGTILPTPSFDVVSTLTDNINGATYQIVSVGTTVPVGERYNVSVTGRNVTVTAVSGDTQVKIVSKLMQAINAANSGATTSFVTASNNPGWFVIKMDTLHSAAVSVEDSNI
jgi:hypothetical protein